MFAAPQAATLAHTGPITGLGEVTLALVVVLVAIFALAWVLRQLRSVGNRVGTAIDVIAHVPLGQKERAVLLQVGGCQILLGVAPGRVNTLYVLPEPLELARGAGAPAPERPASFRTLLLRSLGK
jgi:flagellar protein FliO/FliZ